MLNIFEDYEAISANFKQQIMNKDNQINQLVEELKRAKIELQKQRGKDDAT